MGVDIASKSFFLLHLLLFMYLHGSGAAGQMTEKHGEKNPKENTIPGYPMDDGHRKGTHTSESPMGHPLQNENNVLRLPSMDADGIDAHPRSTHAKEEDVHGNPSSHMDHIDISLLVFFTMNDLKVGERMAIYFPKKDPSSSPPLLPRERTDSIPFSYQKLAYLLDFFSFSHGSPQAKAMENTLRQCGIKPIKGETKFCATSLEFMFDFVSEIFGMDSQFKVVTTSYLTKSSTLLQNYTVLEVPKEIPASKMVACHTMPYPYTVFYCHSQESETKVFLVSLVGDNGDKVEAVAVCHMDTSQWSLDHVSFRVLGIEPGSSHVCHFFPPDNLVYVPIPTSAITSKYTFVM